MRTPEPLAGSRRLVHSIMAPPEVNDRDVPREDVVDESLMPHCSDREDNM